MEPTDIELMLRVRQDDLAAFQLLARRYRDDGADELVFYDIKASTVGATVRRLWVARVICLLRSAELRLGGPVGPDLHRTPRRASPNYQSRACSLAGARGSESRGSVDSTVPAHDARGACLLLLWLDAMALSELDSTILSA